MSVEDNLTRIFREVFDDDTITINPATTANDVPGWDSLSHVHLIAAIEKGFGVKFSQKELLMFKNVGDLLNALHSKTLS